MNTENNHCYIIDEDSTESTGMTIDLPSMVQRRTSDESTVMSISQAAKATHQFQTSPQVYQLKTGLSAITSRWVSERVISEGSRDDDDSRGEDHIFHQFSASLSDIMSKVVCTNFEGTIEPDSSVLQDEEFYWPSSAQSFDTTGGRNDEDDMHVATSPNFLPTTFYVSH